MKRILVILTLTSIICSVAHGDRTLTDNEVEVMFESLSQNPSQGWIDQGCIVAVCQSFNSDTGETTESQETIITDGNRFHWNIQEQSLKNGGQFIPRPDQMKWNQNRTFVWDGQTYTMYFKSGGHAISQELPDIPVKLTGPLTAGHIPWGEGLLTAENLNDALTSATETLSNEGSQIELTVTFPNLPDMFFVLDPEKKYAVLSHTRMQSGDVKTVQTYGNYTQLGGRYIPMNILIETFEHNRLRSSEIWEIVSIQDDIPSDEIFSADFEEKTLVEHYTPLLDKPSYYRHSNRKDMKLLLEERWAAGLKKRIQKQNCASVAVGHILRELDSEASDTELTSLVNDISGNTNLYQIQQFLETKGLHGMAVKTDVQSLRKLNNCQILIHFPQKKHFVVLDRIDSKQVWLIDLDRQTFYHILTLDEFEQRWAGIALIVSNEALTPGQEDIPVPDPILKRIKGSADYSCSKLLQEYRVIHCPVTVRGTCGSRYELYYPRYACEVTTDDGFCSGSGVVGSVYADCIEDPYDPGQCTITGDWTSRFMRACQP